ncbi:CBBY-like protein [Vitis vinifera]|uniref:CBBY-like protein n=1 Tax=Vitis vinifera TaxID=29760 RepID=A0A438BQW7_VITVI|nr:CBBY-like protein [Vitis vinifera]
MASTVISSSSASTKALLSHRKASVTALQSHERTFSSSLLGTRPGITRRAITTTTTTTTTRPVIRRGARHSGVRFSVCSALPSALLFDCDGVLVDTEKDGHRISFNDTFAERELGVTWDVDLYGELLKIGGGKERLIDQALGKGVNVAVCSTSNEKAVSAIVSCLLGPERAEKIKIFAGDVVPRKKPDPAIYTLAASTLGVEPSRCVVVEDSAIGLAAAKAAGMKCIVTKSGYTADEDFLNADAVFDCIGDPPEERFDLAFCGSLLEKQYVS